MVAQSAVFAGAAIAEGTRTYSVADRASSAWANPLNDNGIPILFPLPSTKLICPAPAIRHVSMDLPSMDTDAKQPPGRHRSQLSVNGRSSSFAVPTRTADESVTLPGHGRRRPARSSACAITPRSVPLCSCALPCGARRTAPRRDPPVNARHGLHGAWRWADVQTNRRGADERLKIAGSPDLESPAARAIGQMHGARPGTRVGIIPVRAAF